MNDRMKPISLTGLIHWILSEYHRHGSIFGITRFYQTRSDAHYPFLSVSLETPLGPAAGPHTQLAQNIVTSYLVGARYFELKTVQIIDGEDLQIQKPCISVIEEGYNAEWSTELTVEEAMQEYMKAWILLHILSKEFHLGQTEGFAFHMSVGYTLEGIQSDKIDHFIEGLKDAASTTIFTELLEEALTFVPRFHYVTESDIREIPRQICDSISLSTLHGCPVHEVEEIVGYLLECKNLHVLLKCNPTLVGYDYARKSLDEFGYSHVAFDSSHFEEDLSLDQLVLMIYRLKEKALSMQLHFGIKLSNTLPVLNQTDRLEGDEVYLSGAPLLPLCLEALRLLRNEFPKDLQISYSGGADAENIQDLLLLGFHPITVSTALLKPGGYYRLLQMVDNLSRCSNAVIGANLNDTKAFDQAVIDRILHTKNRRNQLHPNTEKNTEHVPLFDCACAPCIEEGGCPIKQDIPRYLRLYEEGRYLEAFDVILDRNPLPFTLGTLCSHPCTRRCNRQYYDQAVDIRTIKLEIAHKAFETTIWHMEQEDPIALVDQKVAIIGAGPAGIAAASILARLGITAVVFEEREVLGGAVIQHLTRKHKPLDYITRDIKIAEVNGATFVVGRKIHKLQKLKAEGYDVIICACGRHTPSSFYVENGIEIDQRGRVILDASFQTSLEAVYVIGESRTGPSTIVDTIADAFHVCEALLIEFTDPNDLQAYALPMYAHNDKHKEPHAYHALTADDYHRIYARRGCMESGVSPTCLASHCLECNTVCEFCVEVCPNRANIMIQVSNHHQIIHIDDLCNACGNCETFCPYDSAPYIDKIILYKNEQDFYESRLVGLYYPNAGKDGVIIRVLHDIVPLTIEDLEADQLAASKELTMKELDLWHNMIQLSRVILKEYSYLLQE